MTVDRCEYSDLPTTECWHCDPRPRLPARTTPGLMPEWERRLRVATVEDIPHTIATRALPPIHVRHLQGRAETLVDYVMELCDWVRHGEPYQVQHRNPDGTHTFITQRHSTTTAPLLLQLGAAMPTSGAETGGAHAFESKSPARDDAISTLMVLEDDVYAWLADLEHVKVTKAHDLWPDLNAAVRHLGALAGPITCSKKHGKRDKDTKDWCCTGHNIEADIRTWHTQARITTGWDSPAWKPANTCPLCGTKGSLRVRLEEHTGMCVKCRETWTHESIGLLADHIRAENADPFNPLEVEDDTPEKLAELA